MFKPVCLLFLAWGVVACNGASTVQPSASPSTQVATPSQAVTTRIITRAESGDKWPFTVDKGELDCVPTVPGERSGYVILKTDQGTYAVNGTARGRKDLYKDVKEIWRDVPDVPGAKVSVKDVIDAGLDICAASPTPDASTNNRPSTSASPSSRTPSTAAASEAVLTANDPNSQINLRATPSITGKRQGYGVVGDQVQVIDQTTSEGYTWYRVQFPRSEAQGWIRQDFIDVDGTAQQPSPSAPNGT